MRKHVNKIKLLAVATTVTAMLAIVVAKLDAGGDPPTVRALVLADQGESPGIVTIMQAQGWTVTLADAPNAGSNDLASQFDVVWIPAQANSIALYRLVNEDVEVFTLRGGIVVITGVNGASLETGTSVDIAPGGPDAKALPPEGAGPMTIVAADHPLVTGEGIGGSALTAADFDPAGGGGRESLLSAPQSPVVIAQNSEGPSVLEYEHGQGRVLVDALLDPSDACGQNLVLYVHSLVQ